MVNIAGILPVWTRRPVARFVELLTPSNRTVRGRWIRRPKVSAGEEVCLFVAFAPGNVVPEHSIFHARSWAKAGFRVFMLIISDGVAEEVATDTLSFAEGLFIRENRGYDFGAWASAIEQVPGIRKASLLALVNDSLFGPLDTFRSMLEGVRTADADVLGATESVQVVRHFQSFLLFFKQRALKSGAFWHFWRSVRAGGRLVAIYRYEMGLLQIMERAGLKCAPLFGAGSVRNSTLLRWRELIDEGFPYVKVATLRDNPFNVDLSGWSEILRSRGYDPQLAQKHLSQHTKRRSFARFRL
jgi:lipopolysaccharide biosynthesis protein